MPVDVSASIVIFHTPAPVLERCLRSLAAAVVHARDRGLLGRFQLHLVDNSVGPALGRDFAGPGFDFEVEVHAGHGNVGYARGNNLVLERLDSQLHLVMNPDVELAPDALAASIEAMARDPDIGLVAPAVRGERGDVEFLCKRYPTVWVLFLRGFAPPALRRRFEHHVARYEMRDVIGDELVKGIPLASGCFMLVRTGLLREVGGFDPRFFLYFEDYDLSLRIGRRACIAYVPHARIVHHGGDASRKGWRHVLWFVTSAWRFFSRHGWKIA